MCSVHEEDIENFVSQQQAKGSKEELGGRRTCMKCALGPAVVVVRLNDPLCKSCFLAYFTHKFRATIGKARVIRAGENILLAFSGGLSSSAMLHLVCEGLSGTAPKKLRFEPGLAFVDEGEVLKQSVIEHSSYIEQIRGIVSRTEFPFHLVKLEDIFSRSVQDDTSCCKRSEKAEKLKSLFDAIPSVTEKEDLLKTLRNQLLLAVARKEGYSKVMVADCATRLSVRLLSNVSQGRGGDLPYDTGFSDDRHGDVIFVRPMREFMTKEIALYNFFNSVQTVVMPTLSTMSHSHVSIDRLTEEFVSGLQAALPFTVSTIFRTGDKLSVKEFTDEVASCALCAIPLSVNPILLSTLTDGLSAVQFNADNKTSPQSVTECCGSCESGCSNSSTEQPVTGDNILETLCYGCRLTFRNTKFNPSDLPSFVLDATKKSLHRAQMKEQIKDFLLDD